MRICGLTEHVWSTLQDFAKAKRKLDILDTYTLYLRALVDSGQDLSATIQAADRVHAEIEGPARLIENRYLLARQRALSMRRR